MSGYQPLDPLRLPYSAPALAGLLRRKRAGAAADSFPKLS